MDFFWSSDLAALSNSNMLKVGSILLPPEIGQLYLQPAKTQEAVQQKDHKLKKVIPSRTILGVEKKAFVEKTPFL